MTTVRLVLLLSWVPMAVTNRPTAAQDGASTESDTAIGEALALRLSLGLDPITLSAMDVSPDSYEEVIRAASVFMSENASVLSPLIDRWLEGRQNLWESSAEEAETERSEVIKADLIAIRQAAAAFEGQIHTKLGVAFSDMVEQAITNAMLDPILRLVPLTLEQTQALTRATMARDRVALSPYNWHRHDITETAWQEFERRKQAVLTPEQDATYETYRKSANVNLTELLRRERAAITSIRRSAVEPRNQGMDRPPRWPWNMMMERVASAALDLKLTLPPPDGGARRPTQARPLESLSP